MKNILKLLVIAGSALTLAGCGGGDSKDGDVKNVSGGSEEEREAIQTAVRKSIAIIGGSNTVLIGGNYSLLEENGDYLTVATKYNVKVASSKRYDVNIEWDLGTEGSGYVSAITDVDSVHKMVEFNYPGQGGAEGDYTFSIKKISCGGASSTNPEVSYKVHVTATPYKHYDVNIKDVYKLQDLGSGKYGYDIIDYSLANPWFKQQPENVGKGDPKKSGYYYVNVTGKIIYVSPDSNWGLIADGDDVLEIYCGNILNIKPERFPAINNEYVSVVSNLGHYYGNMQTSFITEMKKKSASDLLKEPTLNYRVIDKDTITGIKNEFGGHKQCVHMGGQDINLPNSLAQMTGSYIDGSLKNKDGDPTTVDKIKSSERFTFKISVGGEEVVVAYDYHTDKEGSVGVFNDIKAMLQGSGDYTIKGTLRYHGDDANGFVQSSTIPGDWQITPFLQGHVAKK